MSRSDDHTHKKNTKRSTVLRALPATDAPLLHRCAAFASKDTWAQYLRGAGLRVQVAPDDLAHLTDWRADLSAVEFAICWAPPPGLLQRVRAPGADLWPWMRSARRAPHPCAPVAACSARI